jgi:hypothetical protein
LAVGGLFDTIIFCKLSQVNFGEKFAGTHRVSLVVGER